jgi:hypothetical protein
LVECALRSAVLVAVSAPEQLAVMNAARRNANFDLLFISAAVR